MKNPNQIIVSLCPFIENDFYFFYHKIKLKFNREGKQ
jgi:hypothetical protein